MSENPFDEENIAAVLFIQLSRCYDVLMGIYTHLDKHAAVDLLELHQKGLLLTPTPYMTGQFVTDELNKQD